MASRRPRTRDSGPHILSVYDGSLLLGHIHERGRTCEARRWPDGTLIGVYPNRRSAADAIGAVHNNLEGQQRGQL
jgi:hypothetical protein